MNTYDLVVIGSGVGLTVLNNALQFGLKCCLIENTKIGGTCLTRGCIPSKVLVYPADVIREAQHSTQIGLDLKISGVDWDLISKRMWSQINENKEMEKGLSTVKGLDLFKGTAVFSGEYEMQVKSLKNDSIISTFKGERFVIASGARSLIPPIKNIEDVEYIANETFFGGKFPKKPWKSLIIIGGGVIAAEFAHIFSAMGTEVTIIEMLPRLVATEEPEISSVLEKNFKKHMNVLLNSKAVEANKEGKKKTIFIENMINGERSEVAAEEIFIATGRKSNADILEVEKTGIETDAKGWIKTDKYLQTTKQNIWCIGDANGLYQFRHKANYEAEICVRNIFGNEEDKTMAEYSSVPWAIYSYPQIGHVGMTEKEAIDKGRQIFVATKRYSSVAKGFAMGFKEGDIDDGLIKLIVDKSYEILGAHIIGPNAAVLVQPFVYLMNAGFTCNISDFEKINEIPKIERACPEGGSFMPIYHSMVIHPSLNEVTAWAIGNLRPVNIKHEHHHHHVH